MNIFGSILAAIFGRRPAPSPSPPTPPVTPPIIPPSPPVPFPTPSPTDPASATAMFLAINAARLANGRAALARDANLSAIAAAWAARIAASGVLSHGDFAGRIAAVVPGRASGETIGEGFPTAQAEVAGWANDPPHRAILLGRYTTVGVGVGVGRDGSIAYVADFLQ